MLFINAETVQNVWPESHLHVITKTHVHIYEYIHRIYRICWLNLHSACCVIDASVTEIRKEGSVNQHLLCAIKTETQLQPELPIQLFMWIYCGEKWSYLIVLNMNLDY